MYLKIHERPGQGKTTRVVALCDKELIGKVLGKGDAMLDLNKYKNFYVGQLVDERKAVELLSGAENLNLVGANSINAAHKALGIDGKAAKKISGVPHLQVYRV